MPLENGGHVEGKGWEDISQFISPALPHHSPSDVTQRSVLALWH